VPDADSAITDASAQALIRGTARHHGTIEHVGAGKAFGRVKSGMVEFSFYRRRQQDGSVVGYAKGHQKAPSERKTAMTP
jgi:hypothetical protein